MKISLKYFVTIDFTLLSPPFATPMSIFAPMDNECVFFFFDKIGCFVPFRQPRHPWSLSPYINVALVLFPCQVPMILKTSTYSYFLQVSINCTFPSTNLFITLHKVKSI